MHLLLRIPDASRGIVAMVNEAQKKLVDDPLICGCSRVPMTYYYLPSFVTLHQQRYCYSPVNCKLT